MTAFAQEEKCTEDNVAGYKVGEVRISSPLRGIFSSVDETLKELLMSSEMPVKAGQDFQKSAARAGFSWLKQHFPALQTTPQARVAARFSGYTIENCDEVAKRLDVVYKIYSFEPAYYLSRSFEINKERNLKRTVAKTDATQNLARYFIQPIVGYDQSRKLVAGAKFTARTNEKSPYALEVDFTASPNSLEAKAEILGARERAKGFIRYTEWRLGYEHSNLPTTNSKLKQSNFLGQFYAATRAVTNNEVIVRFGAEIQGGNQQTDFSPNGLPSNLTENNRFAAVNSFVGASANIGKHSFKVSYGLRVGSASKNLQVDYAKQVFDVAGDWRVKVASRRNLEMRTQLSFGTIKTYNVLPVRERFFGGATEQNFIDGDFWQIPANPVIRSFPANRFSQPNLLNNRGGDSFAAFNLTASVPIWKRALVPDEIAVDPANPDQINPELKSSLDLEFGIIQKTLENVYLGETENYKKVIDKVRETKQTITELRPVLESIPNPNGSPDIQEQLEELLTEPTGTFVAVETFSTKIIKEYEDKVPDLATITTLFFGIPSEQVASEIETLNDALKILETHLPTAKAQEIANLRQQLNTRSDTVKILFEDMKQSVAGQESKTKAGRDVQYSQKIINYLIRDANLISLSPVFIFDAAKISQRNLRGADFRYGIGGGIKVNFISLDVTAGYVFNPQPKPWESRGAVLFKIEVSDIFR